MDKLKYICETETIETPQTYRSFLYSHSEGIYSIPEDDYLLDPVKTKTAIENRKKLISLKMIIKDNYQFYLVQHQLMETNVKKKENSRFLGILIKK